MTASRGWAMSTGNAPSHEDATVAPSLSGYSDEPGAVSEIGFLDSSVVLARYARRIRLRNRRMHALCNVYDS